MILYWSAASDAANQISDSWRETFACDATSPIRKAIENMFGVQLSVSIFKEKLPSAQSAPKRFANLGCEPYCPHKTPTPSFWQINPKLEKQLKGFFFFLNQQQPLAWALGNLLFVFCFETTFPAFKSGEPTLRRITLATASIKRSLLLLLLERWKQGALPRHCEEQTLKSNLSLAWTITNPCWSILKLL